MGMEGRERGVGNGMYDTRGGGLLVGEGGGEGGSPGPESHGEISTKSVWKYRSETHYFIC